MPHNSVQLRSKAVERNASEFLDYESLLIFNPPANDDIDYLSPAAVITFDYGAYQYHQRGLEEKVIFSLEHDANELYDAALIYLPKSKGELDLVLSYLAPMMKQGADVFLVGEKKAGIASAAKKLDSLGSNNSKIDSAKHCQLWQVTYSEQAMPFLLDDWLETYQVCIKEREFQVSTIPGVFSFGSLDQGTELLLNNMFTKLEGRILDFGCGCGVVGAYTKLLNPSIYLEMIDTNLLALICAEKTLKLNSINGKVYPSDGWTDVQGRVSGIVTNPPFHSGVSTEYQTTETFVRKAKDKMSKHAPLLLVANNFLRYASIIESVFGRSDVLVENTKFRVYKAFR